MFAGSNVEAEEASVLERLMAHLIYSNPPVIDRKVGHLEVMEETGKIRKASSIFLNTYH
jgi:hypothetical protein